MSRQSRLVLLLLLSVGVFQLALSNTIVVRDEVPDSKLDVDDILPLEGEKQHIRISTPKVKEIPLPSSTSEKTRTPTATSTQKTVSDNLLNDLVEASKHSEALSKDER